MTLHDVFKPNKYDTVPTIVLLGVGHIRKINDCFARLTLDGSVDELIDLETEAKLIDTKGIRINHPVTMSYSICIEYLVPLTPEYYLIHNAIEPITHAWMLTKSDCDVFRLTPEIIERLQPDGSGWRYGEPANFFAQDILYRLDLQGKLP